jgi:hypothetical protein
MGQNNKAHKSGGDDPNCDQYGSPETMEHVLRECGDYSHSQENGRNPNEIPKLECTPRVGLGF